MGTAFARSIAGPLQFRAPFADLRGEADGTLRRLDLVFDSMDASMGRSDLCYGGTTQDEEGRRVPLDAEEADRPVRFMSKFLRLPEGDRAGEPFTPAPFQDAFLRRLHGWRTPGGHRR